MESGRPKPNQSLIWNHPNTQTKIKSITDPKLVVEIDVEYQIAAAETRKNLFQLQSGVTSNDLINRMLLPDESFDKSNSLPASVISKVNSKTGIEYEVRFGVELMITNKRVILTDVNRDDTPILEHITTTKFDELNSIGVGHIIQESVFYQPVNHSQIYSVQVDIHNKSEASRQLMQKRNMMVFYIGILLAIVGLFTHWSVIIGGVALAIAGYAFLKTIAKLHPIIITEQYRSIKIGLIDPLTLNRSIWKIILHPTVHPEVLIEWASKLQSKIVSLHGDKAQTIFEL
jgi:type IV secretory pathway TrbD component